MAPSARFGAATLVGLGLLLAPAWGLAGPQVSRRPRTRNLFGLPKAAWAPRIASPLQVATSPSPTSPAKAAKKPGRSGVVQGRVDVSQYDWQSLPEMWKDLSRDLRHEMALVDDVHEPKAALTFGELHELMIKGAAAMQSLGLGVGECVSLFSENSHRWLVVEQAAMAAGGCNAVRGASAPVDELKYLYANSQSVAAVVETPALLKKIYAQGGLASDDGWRPKFIIVLYPGGQSGAELAEAAGVGYPSQVVTYEELMAIDAEHKPVQLTAESPATLVYTSGTTSKPKGVVLKHRNLLHQVYGNSFHDNKPLGPANPAVGDVFVSILPCWHIFERTAEYWFFSRGVQTVYSNIRNFKKDLVKQKPQFLVAVPRLFETIHKGVQDQFRDKGAATVKLVAFFSAVARIYYANVQKMRGLVLRSNKPSIPEKFLAAAVAAIMFPLTKIGDLLVWRKVRAGLGGRIKVMLSGGSALPTYLEDFFSVANMKVLVGYGLTETSPVISSRTVDSNIPGTVGRPAVNTEVRIVNPESKQPVEPGSPGLILAKGPQVMSGYQRNADATAKAIDLEGFFDTGDLGRINPATGHLLITGRAKDTVVLSNGENVEPAPIEDAIIGNVDLVDQIMLVGQDEKYLGGIVVVNAKEAAAQGFLTKEEADEVMAVLGGTPMTTGLQGDREKLRPLEAKLNESKAKEAVLRSSSQATKGKGFASWENMQNCYLRLEPFTVENGQLTQTLKVKRNVVTDVHDANIKAIYA